MERCRMPGGAAAGLAHQVLVVEDDDDLRDAIVMVLERGGLSVHSARNGCEALQLLHQVPRLPCVALVDLMMPLMNGVELRAALAATPSLAALPVVFMSALGEPRALLPRAESTPVLSKPLSMASMMSLVHRSCVGTCAGGIATRRLGHRLLAG